VVLVAVISRTLTPGVVPTDEDKSGGGLDAAPGPADRHVWARSGFMSR
jgi:hypothetical protein